MCRNANIPIYKKSRSIKEEEVFLKSALWEVFGKSALMTRKSAPNVQINRTKCS